MSGNMEAIRVALRMSSAALAFLGSLDEWQRKLAWLPFESDDERTRWFYTPTDHGGLPLAAMRPSQQRLALTLVAAGVSRPGFVTISTIMGLENVLDEIEGWTATWNRDRGRDPSLYYLQVFGSPGSDAPWSWRFGGHHVSIHHLVLGGEVQASTPCFLGADPASSPFLGSQVLRPLGSAEDLGRKLVHALDAKQRGIAVVSDVAPIDLVGGNRSRLSEGDLPLRVSEIFRDRFDGALGELVERIQSNAEQVANLRSEHLDAVRLSMMPKGVPASTFTADQRQQLRALLDVYVGRLPDALAEIEAAKYDNDRLGSLWFAWAGGIEPGEPHYYRVQGSDLFVEYDNTQRQTNHVHSVWRNPQGDFGSGVLLRHYATEH